MSSSKRNLEAVKAVIYRDGGELLLQQRDNVPSLPFPGAWNFFGGYIEEGELPKDAIIRELTEELGVVPGKIGDELEHWSTFQNGVLNHYFPILYIQPAKEFVLGEGCTMQWTTLPELVNLQLTPSVFHSISNILKWFEKSLPTLADQIERNITEQAKLQKKNNRVFYARNNLVSLSIQQIIMLKELATYRNLPIFRVCLHQDDECDIHEMLMVHTCPQKVEPHKQNKSSLSYHLYDGEIELSLHNDEGDVTWSTNLMSNSSASPKSVRLDAGVFRSMKSKSHYSVFLEVASGPFKDKDTIWFDLQKK